MLIVEGADCVGKTTLCKELVRALNEAGWPHVYHHLGLLPPCWRERAEQNYARIMAPYVVQDRFHLSEPIYAAARGDEPMLDVGQFDRVNRSLHGYGGFQVVVLAESQVIRQRFHATRLGQMYDLDTVLEVNDQYRQAAARGRWSGYPVNVDYVVNNHDDMAPGPVAQRIVEQYVRRLCREGLAYPGARTGP